MVFETGVSSAACVYLLKYNVVKLHGIMWVSVIDRVQQEDPFEGVITSACICVEI